MIKADYFKNLFLIGVVGFIVISLLHHLISITYLQVAIILLINILAFGASTLIYQIVKKKIAGNEALFLVMTFAIKFLLIGITFAFLKNIFPTSNHTPFFLFLIIYSIFLIYDITYKVKALKRIC